ncbi:MAG: hypothetical protein LBQ43_02900 [Holosporales bacterium]|nr:hypothetical protein [Holosporales bacterium]
MTFALTFERRRERWPPDRELILGRKEGRKEGRRQKKEESALCEEEDE